LGVLGCVLSRLPRAFKHLALVCLGGQFLLYRIALALLKPGTACKCLGTLTEKLHVDDRTAGLFLTVLSLYLVVGGAWFYFRRQSGLGKRIRAIHVVTSTSSRGAFLDRSSSELLP
jgi:hypothetical protein